jgi:hypothetical protein
MLISKLLKKMQKNLANKKVTAKKACKIGDVLFFTTVLIGKNFWQKTFFAYHTLFPNYFHRFEILGSLSTHIRKKWLNQLTF